MSEDSAKGYNSRYRDKAEPEEESKLIPEKTNNSSFEEFFKPTSFNERKKGTEFVCIFNVINTIVGAGILTLPFFTMKIGLVLSILLVISVGILNGFTLFILIKCKNMSFSCEYVEIANKALGMSWGYFCKFLIIVHNTGMQVIYILVFATTMTQTFSKLFPQECSKSGAKFYCSNNFFILCTAPFIVPFIFKRTTDKLKFASFLGVFAHMVFCIILYINFFIKYNNGTLAKVSPFPEQDKLLLEGISLIPSVFVAYHCHINFFPIINSLHEPTDKKTLRVISVSLFFCILVYLSVALSGVFCFGKDTNENFLQSFDIKEIGVELYYTVNISFGLAVLFVYPMVFFKARDHLQEVFGVEATNSENANSKKNDDAVVKKSPSEEIKKYDSKEPSSKSNENRKNDASYQRRKLIFKVFSFLYFFATLGLTLLSQSYFMEVFNLVGLFGVTFIAYIGPMLFYLSLSKKAGRRRGYTYYSCLFGLIFVVSLTFISIICGLYLKSYKH